MNWTLRLLLLAAPVPALCSADPLSIFLLVSHERCGYGNGEIIVNVSGGLPPYTYLWDDGNTEGYRTNLVNGNYSVTVTDSNSDQVSDQAFVASIPYVINMGQPWPFCDTPAQLFPGGDFEPPPGAVEPWYVNGVPMDPAPGSVPGLFVFHPAGSGTYTYDFADGNGCTGTISGVVGPQITTWPTLTITNIEPSCSNQNTGSVSYQATSSLPYDNVLIQLVTENGVNLPLDGTVNETTLDGTISSIPPGDYGISWWLGTTLESLVGQCEHDTLWFTVPSLGPACGWVSGTSWYDSNGDCIRDLDEVGIPHSPLLLQPGGDMLLTNNTGTFNYPLMNGTYTLEQTDPSLIPICPAVQPVAFTANANTTVIDLANGSTAPLDLGVSISSGQSSPGFAVTIHGNVANNSPQISGAVTVSMTLDPAVNYSSATPAPATVVGNALTWEFPAFTSFHSESMHVLANVPAGTALGTILTHSISASNTGPEPDLGNNTSNVPIVVVGSYDPNDKTALTSSRTSTGNYFIDLDAYIDYTIRFQNTGTAEAHFITVTDTVSPELDMLSFEQGVASHPFTVSFKPDRVVEWRFDNINLPDSNANETESHGLVSFRIKPVLPLLPGTTIANTANIYFDFNEPVITGPSVLIVDFSTGVADHGSSEQGLTALPNPATDRVRIITQGNISMVRLLDLNGRTALSQRATGQLMELDVRTLPAAVYIVEARLHDGGILRTKLIVGK